MTREEAIAILEVSKHMATSGRMYNQAIDLAIESLSSEAVQGYTEWLEKIIVEAETFEWLCENAADEEWCEKNCNYPSTQAECLRHLYEVNKGGDTE